MRRRREYKVVFKMAQVQVEEESLVITVADSGNVRKVWATRG